MADMHLYAKLLMDMLGEMLGGVYTAVLTARATEAEHQRGEATLDVSVHMMVSEGIYMIEELEYLAVILQEADYRFVQAREFLVRLIASGIVGAAAVEYIAAAIARSVLGDALLVREA